MADMRRLLARAALAAAVGGLGISPTAAKQDSARILDSIGASRGICVVLNDAECELGLDLARASKLTVYLQLPQAGDAEEARRAADAAGLYGTRIYVDKGDLKRLHLADNVADAVVAIGDAETAPEAEVLRVLRPGGKALLGTRELTKPFPEGIDDWSHPYHGPDNNPQSKDRIARAPYLTQFLAEPRHGPSPQVAVASAGRVFKAFGNVAWHKREEAFLDTLVAFNGYNGTMLWKRQLPAGVMVHRNTIIATPTTLYLGDDKSCKLIDPATGRLTGQIAPPADVAGGTFWKWMALQDGVLYAVMGEQERRDPVMRWERTKHGWSWNEISAGYAQPTPPWGFGRTVLALDPETGRVLWTHRENEPIDTRAVCMSGGRIYIFRFSAFLACLDARTGDELWRKTPDNDPQLFEKLGEYQTRQGYQTNWRTAMYLKCSDKALYFAGSQVAKLLAVSAEDGSVLWEDPYDNFQLVLRDDGLYGISGHWRNNVSKKLDPLTGEVLADLNIGRRACTRPTGSIDAIFYRAMGGSVRFDVASARPRWVSPMRPSCHDGVTVANGLLYWWPWACDCQLTLYGVTCLGPAGDFDFGGPPVDEPGRLERGPGALAKTASLPESPADWPTFRGNNQCSATTEVIVSEVGKPLWQSRPRRNSAWIPTAPVAVGGLVFVGGSDGTVQALAGATGEVQWTAYTGGAIRLPPTVWKSRVFVGSGDGWVYCFEPRSGGLSWRFRAAPQERRIPVYGSLLSTWPAASGVLVEDGTAYVAAGIVNYDGTYVYALDAATGRVKWRNNTSGHLDRAARTGVSVQGHLLLHHDKLYLAGGNAVSPAVYDASNGKCLNKPDHLEKCESMHPRGWELFLIGDKVVACGRPFHVDFKTRIYDTSVSSKLLVAPTGDKDVIWLDNRKIMCFARIDRKVLSNCVTEPEYHGYRIPAWGKFDVPDQPLWEHDCEGSAALAVCKNAVVVAGKARIAALNITDGGELWARPLPSPPVAWGLAVDREGRTVVSLEDGGIVCFQ